MMRMICTVLLVSLVLAANPVTAEEVETGAVSVEKEPAKASENTLDACRDSADNDVDGHIDCDDQDCQIYAICVEQPEPEESGEAGGEEEEEAEEKLAAAPEDEVIHRPFSLGFVPGLSTDGGSPKPTRNNFSLNFIGWGDYLIGADVGYIGNIRKHDVEGFQGASIFNYTNGEMRGFQAAGILNVTHGPFSGFEGAGIANVSGGDFKGFQGAGIASVSSGEFKGLKASGIAGVTGGQFYGFQGAGIANVTGDQARGFQGAGIANVTVGPFSGFQAAGISNYAWDVHGAQISGIANVAPGRVRGLQAGLINVGGSVRGAQIGLINVAYKEMKGAPIGLINYAGDGIFAPTIWSSDNSVLNLGLKMGSKYVYSILGMGIHPIKDQERLSIITGIGGHIDIDRWWVDIDVVLHHLYDSYHWSDKDVDLITKLRPTVGFRVIDQLSIFAGPTLNLLVSDVRKEAELIPGLWDRTADDINVRLSLGFIAGLQFEPKWGSLNSR